MAAAVETEAVSDISCSVTLYVTIATVLVAIYFIYTQFWKAESWKKYGVKEVSMGRDGFTDFRLGIHNLLQQHGDTVGFTMGDMFLVTRDVDLLRQIMVKDFNNFVDRLVAMSTLSPIEKGLFFLGGQDWKRIRQILSPSFSTGKIKGFSKATDESARKLSTVMEEFARKGELIPIKFTSGQYTSEIIARLAFGLRTDCLGKEDDEFTHYSKTIFKVRSKLMSMVMLVLLRSPKLHNFLVKTLKIRLFDSFSTAADTYFNSILHRTVSERQENARKGDQKYHDFLETLVTAKDAGDKAVAAAAAAGLQVDQSLDSAPKTMTDTELIGQAMLIIFAGFESTSSTLQWCLYLLAKHPEIQEKVFKEIEKFVSSETPTYDELGQLRYTTQVIDETLRLYPPAPIVTRKALETVTLGSITIPKGAAVVIPLDEIMMDPRHYQDPQKFDPDRFTEENKASRDPMAFVPFGYGPRLCIGMRLAYLELKLALVHVLRKVKVELSDRTEPKVGEDVATSFQGIIIVDTPIKLEVKLRDAF